MAKKSITITLKLGELLYDIQNKTHLTARDRKDARQSAHMQATDDAESLNAAKRYLSHGLSVVRASISEWAPVDAVVADNSLSPADMRGTVTYILSMPANYNDGVTPVLTSSMHAYVMNTAIAAWMGDVSPEDVPRYAMAAAAALLDVRHALLERKRPDRRRPCSGSGSGSSGGVTPSTAYLWLDNTLWQDTALWLEHG